jgi:hypothetical protein
MSRQNLKAEMYSGVVMRFKMKAELLSEFLCSKQHKNDQNSIKRQSQ